MFLDCVNGMSKKKEWQLKNKKERKIDEAKFVIMLLKKWGKKCV